VNLGAQAGNRNVNMVTCGGQATIPIVAAVSQVAPVAYAEIVASIASRSAGPGTRANIDEFTETTARAIEQIGGVQLGKAIIVLNPAEPPLIMRDTVFCLVETNDTDAIRASIERMVTAVQDYVPGYRLKQDVQFDRIGPNDPVRLPGGKAVTGTKVTVFLEVEGAGDFLPKYAGNLDVMTSAALRCAEQMIELNAGGR
jgi:acetaldehyde dehydrogenase